MKARCFTFDKKSCKLILMILLWQCATNLTSSLFLKPSIYTQYVDIRTAIIINCIEAFILLFSPLAGMMSDLTFGRFKVLKYSTFVMLAAVIIVLFAFIMLPTVDKKFGFRIYFFMGIALFAILLYSCGRLFFIVSFIQFGTDQLRDSPTNLSVLFLHMLMWLDNLLNLFTILVWSIPGPEIAVATSNHTYRYNSTNIIVFEVVLSVSAISTIVILSVINRHSSSFLTESIRGNPFKLVCGVLKYALQHKKPTRRSAFTYCGNENPSRIDYGKQIYGGPFTTEQVEDVKVFLKIILVLFSVGPIFLLDLAISTHFTHYSGTYYLASHRPLKKVLLVNGLVSSLLIFICIPVYLVIVKPYFSRFVPNMLKRIGCGIVLLITFFITYLIYNSIAIPNDWFILGNGHPRCQSNRTVFILHKNIVNFPETYMFIFQHIACALYQMLFYISVWEFICCQSPQHMKGLIFGILFALQGFYQLMGTVLSYVFFAEWTLPIFSCQSGYFVFNIVIGLISLCFFTATARLYKYRKRDDICNIYQYAENYYSNIQ